MSQNGGDETGFHSGSIEWMVNLTKHVIEVSILRTKNQTSVRLPWDIQLKDGGSNPP